MVELQEITDNPFVTCKQTIPEVNMMPLDCLETDGVNIQCINSSEFVVGKQTNFNGPVTIINCANAYTEHPMSPDCKDEKEKVEKEKIVIREKVLSKSANMKVQEMAKETESEKKSKFSDRLKLQLKKRPLVQNLTIPAVILIAIAVVVAVVLTEISINPEPKDIKNNQTCFPVPLLSRKACIFTSFNFENCTEKPEEANETGNSLQQHPLPFVVVSESGGNYCYAQDECLEVFKKYKCGSNKMKCNFLVTSEGHFYEDRGWNRTNSLTGPAAGKSLLICFLGNFSNFEYPTYPQIEATKAFIHFGVENDYLAKNYILLPGNEINRENNSIFKIIKKWKNFNETPFTEIAESQTILRRFNKKQHIIYTKENWGGEPATSFIEMKIPIPYVSISHTVTPLCYNLSTCARYLKSMQSFHFSRDFADIAYNFLVDSGGNIYEGRGWERRSSKVGFINGRNLDVAFIGDFSKKVKPTEEQFDGVQFLIEYGVLNGKISEDYSLISANSTSNTLSPGKQVYAVIKTWPHFDPHPKEHIRSD